MVSDLKGSNTLIFNNNISTLNMGSDILRLDISPLLITISIIPDQTSSGGAYQIIIHVTDENGLAVDNATVTLSVTDGNLTPITGLTDTNGDFISTYTDPAVTTSQTFMISATVSKIGYVGSIGPAQITVNPQIPTLTSTEVIPSSADIIVGNTQQFTTICKDQDNNVINCPTIV